MSKRDEFITIIRAFKRASANISEDQYKGLIGQGVNDHGLSRDEAEKILKDEGLKVGQAQSVNYFEVLKLKNEDIENLSDDKIIERVRDAHNKIFREYRDRKDRDNPAVKKKLGQLKAVSEMLNNPNELIEHFHEIIGRKKDHNHKDKPGKEDQPHQSARTIVKFRNGDEATSIPQLATLMEKNDREATDILYQGYLEQGLAGAGEIPLAQAAKAVTHQFSSDRSMGLVAMVSILREKIKFKGGSEASTPKQLARLIDQNQNWEDAKAWLYNGFFALWLEYTNETQLAGTAQKIVSRYGNQQDIGLEELIQRFAPQIGKPEPEVSPSEIDFGNMNSESQKTIQFSIKNVGRGFLHGNVRLESNMPGLQISNTEIQGDGVVTVKLDASALTAKQKHQASLVVTTNGSTITVPVSCYITYPVQNSIRRLAISGFSMAAIALVTRLIIQQFGSSGWLATRLTGAGFTEWEQHWKWVEWFEWPGFEWKVYTLAAPETGVGSVIAFVALGVGVFAYWYFFFRKKSTH